MPNDLLVNEISLVTGLTFFETDIGFFFRFCSVVTANHRLSLDLCLMRAFIGTWAQQPHRFFIVFW